MVYTWIASFSFWCIEITKPLVYPLTLPCWVVPIRPRSKHRKISAGEGRIVSIESKVCLYWRQLMYKILSVATVPLWMVHVGLFGSRHEVFIAENRLNAEVRRIMNRTTAAYS